MKSKGILIRSMEGKTLLNKSIRVSIGTLPQMKLFLNSAKENYSAGWQKVAAEARVRYVESLRSFISTIRGTQKADRTQEHELIVQETVLAAAGISPL